MAAVQGRLKGLTEQMEAGELTMVSVKERERWIVCDGNAPEDYSQVPVACCARVYYHSYLFNGTSR